MVAPNTEINQIRFGDDKEYVLAWNSYEEFEQGVSFSPVGVQLGYRTNPLTSCFKMYRFLSNVQ